MTFASELEKSIPNYYEASPADFEALEAFAQNPQIDSGRNEYACTLARQLPQSLDHFRRIELQHSRSAVTEHRETLVSLERLARNFSDFLCRNPHIDISETGLKPDDIHANSRYLADRLDIWYGPRDDKKADSFFELIGYEAV